MQVVAVAKSVRQSPRKVGLVASLVRGRSVADALVILEHTPKRAAQPIIKTIESARANAENNHNMNPKTLQITALDIGQAASMKRYRPVAHGRAQPFVRRSTHIRVVVEGEERAKKATSKTDSKKSKKSSSKKEEKKDVPQKQGYSVQDTDKGGNVKSSRRTGRRGDK